MPYNTATPDQNRRNARGNDWIRAYAGRHADTVFCDTRRAVASPTDADRLLSSPDNLHPSPEGYKLMADALNPAILAALAKARSLR